MGGRGDVRPQLRPEVPQELHHHLHRRPGQQRQTLLGVSISSLLWLLVQEEECDEVFRKICYIEMVDIATNVTQQVNTEL